MNERKDGKEEENKYKKLCRYGTQCKFINTCFRAHTKQEYNPAKCKFKEGCYNLDCKYFHPNRETIEEYIQKCREFKQKIKKYTKFCNKMTQNSPCNIKGCPFAHSIEEFVFEDDIPDKNKENYIKKFFGSKIQPFMFRPSHINHINETEKEEDEDDLLESLSFGQKI